MISSVNNSLVIPNNSHVKAYLQANNKKNEEANESISEKSREQSQINATAQTSKASPSSKTELGSTIDLRI